MFREFMIKDIAKMLGSTTRVSYRELARGISINSRETKQGDVFFALKGEHTDGHFYTEEALLNGALAVVVEKNTNVEHEILVADTLFALGQLAKEYRNLFNPRTIAITGTNGKTTVKNLLGAILQKKNSILSTKKNYNSLIGLPLTLFDLSSGEDYLVVEMGTSSPGEIKRLCEIAQPDIGVITNIGPGHLKGLGSLEGVRQEKLSLVESLPEAGFAVIGEGISDVSGKNVLRFSLDMCKDIELSEYGSSFTFNGNKFFTRLLGIENVYNCAAALCLTRELDFDYNAQRTGLAEIRPEPGRLEPIHSNGLFIINDSYNANPVSMRAAVNYTAKLKRRKVFVFGDMLELGQESDSLHREIGAYARERCDVLLTFGKRAELYQGKHFKNRDELLRFLIANLEGNEVVLIKASRALHFEEIVSDLLRVWA